MKPVGDRSRLTREEFSETRVVRAKHQRLAGLLREVRKLAADGFEVRVVVEVLGIDIEHDGVLRSELGERAVALVGFGNKEIC